MPKGKYIAYTTEMKEWLKTNIKGKPYKELTEDFNKHFGVNYKQDNIHGFCTRNKLKNGINACFKKGDTPFNKGKKMSKDVYSKIKATMFKKGNTPHNHRPVGSERFDKNGYIEVKVAEPRTWKLKHIVEWEKYNPPINTKKECIMFLDGNRTNYHISNLKKITREQNACMSLLGLWQKNKELNETCLNYVNLHKEIKRKRENGKENRETKANRQAR